MQRTTSQSLIGSMQSIATRNVPEQAQAESEIKFGTQSQPSPKSSEASDCHTSPHCVAS